MSPREHKLLVTNRGEIAVRILRTARRLGLRTVSVYTQVDETAPHAVLADESGPLQPNITETAANAKGYTDIDEILRVCSERDVTLVHPGYGFLSENAEFARRLEEAGVKLLGPSVQVIEAMGLKHRARDLAAKAGVPVVPGSDPSRLVEGVEEAVAVAERIGYPVMLKATAGGGRMGLVVCKDEVELKARFESTQQRAKVSVL